MTTAGFEITKALLVAALSIMGEKGLEDAKNLEAMKPSDVVIAQQTNNYRNTGGEQADSSDTPASEKVDKVEFLLNIKSLYDEAIYQNETPIHSDDGTIEGLPLELDKEFIDFNNKDDNDEIESLIETPTIDLEDEEFFDFNSDTSS